MRLRVAKKVLNDRGVPGYWGPIYWHRWATRQRARKRVHLAIRRRWRAESKAAIWRIREKLGWAA